jgi:hypothetical protein
MFLKTDAKPSALDDDGNAKQKQVLEKSKLTRRRQLLTPLA